MSCCWSIRVGGQSQVRTAGLNFCPFQSSPAARKWPMLVMQEPRKTSSILVPATSERTFTSSGSLGQARIGSVISARSISMTVGVLGVLVGREQLRLLEPLLDRGDAPLEASRCRRSRRRSSSSSAPRWSAGRWRRSSRESATQAAAALRSAAASVSSKACSTVRSGSPSISRMRPLKTFFFPFLGTVRSPDLMAQQRDGVDHVTERDAGVELALEADQHALRHVERHEAERGGEGHQAGAGREADADGEAGVASRRRCPPCRGAAAG